MSVSAGMLLVTTYVFDSSLAVPVAPNVLIESVESVRSIDDTALQKYDSSEGTQQEILQPVLAELGVLSPEQEVKTARSKVLRGLEASF